MKKKRLLVVISISILISSCNSIDQDQRNISESQGNLVQERIDIDKNRGSNRDQGNGPVEVNQHDISSVLTGGKITSTELEGITFMMEEEKLARDVYLRLAEQWNLNIFSNISRSEQAHMDAVKSLIIIFGADDPSAENGLGEFTNQELQDLFDLLIDMGSQNLVEAIKVGGAIEEIDILDLQAYLEDTTNRAVNQVYQNLLQGSINHLASFVRIYERQTGANYQPQYLSQEDYESLISQDSSAGTGQRGQGKNGAHRGNGNSW